MFDYASQQTLESFFFFHANVTNTHSPFDKSRTTSFVEELACYHNLEGQIPVLANFLRRKSHSTSDIALCDLCCLTDIFS